MIHKSSISNEVYLSSDSFQTVSTIDDYDKVIMDSLYDRLYMSEFKSLTYSNIPTYQTSRKSTNQDYDNTEIKYISSQTSPIQQICHNYHENFQCNDGKKCPFIHQDRSITKIIYDQRSNNRYNLLQNYPELLECRTRRNFSYVIELSNL